MDYYTPVGLRQYTGVITLNQTMGQLNPRTGLAPVEALLQYEGGYGFQPAGSSVVDLLKGVMTYRPYDRVTLTLNLQFEKSPLYISRSIDGTIGVSF